MPSFADLIAQLGQGKDGGGQQAADQQPAAFGQADPNQGADQQASPTSDPNVTPGQPNFGPGAQAGLSLDDIGIDPISRFEGQQRGLQILNSFAGRGWQGMGPNTSLARALQGNDLWTQAVAYQRFLDEMRLQAELGKFGIGVPGQEDPTHRAIREEEERRKKDPGVTPGGYNPNPPSKGETAQPPAKF